MPKSNQNLEGQAQISCGKKKDKTLNFSSQLEPFEDFSKCFMSNFSDLELTDKEKRELSRFHRQELNRYRQVPPNDIREAAKKLVDEIKHTKSDSQFIKVHASELGTFACLAAIYSGELPNDKTYYFELGLAPIKVFPEALLNDYSNGSCNFTIHFHDQSNNWLRQFQSLIWHQKLPDHAVSFELDDIDPIHPLTIKAA